MQSRPLDERGHGLEEAGEQEEVGAQPLQRFTDGSAVELERGGKCDIALEAGAAEPAHRDRDVGFGAIESVVHSVAPRGERRQREHSRPAPKLDDARPCDWATELLAHRGAERVFIEQVRLQHIANRRRAHLLEYVRLLALWRNRQWPQRRARFA